MAEHTSTQATVSSASGISERTTILSLMPLLGSVYKNGWKKVRLKLRSSRTLLPMPGMYFYTEIL